MVKVKKKDGSIEEFMKEKIIEGCKRAGTTAEQAMEVAEEVTKKVTKMATVTTDKIADLVLNSLDRINKMAADAYRKFRKMKYKK